MELLIVGLALMAPLGIFAAILPACVKKGESWD